MNIMLLNSPKIVSHDWRQTESYIILAWLFFILCKLLNSNRQSVQEQIQLIRWFLIIIILQTSTKALHLVEARRVLTSPHQPPDVWNRPVTTARTALWPPLTVQTLTCMAWMTALPHRWREVSQQRLSLVTPSLRIMGLWRTAFASHESECKMRCLENCQMTMTCWQILIPEKVSFTHVHHVIIIFLGIIFRQRFSLTLHLE